MRGILPFCVVVVALSPAAGCASHTARLRLDPPSGPLAGTLAELQLAAGTDVVVDLRTGERLRGRIASNAAGLLELSGVHPHRTAAVRLPEADVVLVAEVKGRSKAARGRLGAVVAALISLPFGISMIGDMGVPAALLGAVIGRATGDARAVVVYHAARRSDPQ
jgi:hypothetical protein